MKTIPLKDDRWRVFLDTDEYRTLLESAYEPPSRSARQVRLEMRLMACSMRVDTVSELRWHQFEKRETPEGDRWMCTVEAKDSTDREAETRPRAVFIPNDIMDDVQRYVERRNIGPDDLLFPISTRTIQRDVTRSANHAATKTGDDDFRKVSSHDLRRYFATHLLFRHQVPPPVVRVLGGWKSDDAMFEYLVLPDDVLFERLGEAGLLGTSYDKLSRHDHAEKIAATTTRLAELVEAADEDDVEFAGAGVKAVFEGVEAITVDVEDGTYIDSDGEPDPDQLSFQRFNIDEEGVAYPAATAKVAYVACVVLASWSATFGTLG
jgi:hypothetical protein